MFDGKAFGQEIVGAVKTHISAALAPLAARLDALEKQVSALPAPQPAPDLALVERVFQSDVKAAMADLRAEMKTLIPDVAGIVGPIIAAAIKDHAAAAPKPKDIDPKDVAAIVMKDVAVEIEDVRKSIAAIPAPAVIDHAAVIEEARSAMAVEVAALRDAVSNIPRPAEIDVDAIVEQARAAAREEMASLEPEVRASDLDAVKASIAALDDAIHARVADAIDAIPKPENGKSVEHAEVAKMVVAEVDRVLATWERPENGKSVTIDDVRPMIEDAVARGVAALPKPEDGAPGVGVAGALIDRGGNLILTLSNGSTKELGEVVGRSVGKEELSGMVDDAVAKAVSAIPPAMPGKSVTADDVRPMVAALVDEAVKALPAPRNGVDADPAKTAELVRDEVANAVASLPPATPGKSVTVEDVEPLISSLVAKAVAAIPPVEPKEVDPEMVREMVSVAVKALPEPRPGKDADPEMVERLVEDRVQKAVAAIPPAVVDNELVRDTVAKAVAALPAPEPGRSVTVDDVRPLVADLVAAAVAGIPVPKDGCGVKELLIDRDGALVATMDDGRLKSLGNVVGRNGVDVDMDAVRRQLSEAIAAIPAPQPGKDGLGFDDIDMVEANEGIVLRFAKGDRVKDFLLPVVIDRGVWKLGDTYHRGAGVTFDGSFWISQSDGNTDKPGTSKAWRMAVRKGRDRTDPVKIGE